MEKSQDKIKKESVSISLEPYLRNQINDIIYLDHNFSNVSSFITVAVTEFISRYKMEKEEISAMDLLLKILKTPEGRQAFEKVQFDSMETVEKQLADDRVPKSITRRVRLE